MKIVKIIAAVVSGFLLAGGWWLHGARRPMDSTTATPAVSPGRANAPHATGPQDAPLPPLPLPEAARASEAGHLRPGAPTSENDAAVRAQAVEAATQRIRTLVEGESGRDVREMVEAVRALKHAAGPQGLPGVNLDAAVHGLELAQAMQHKAGELDALARRMQAAPDSVPKEEVDRVTAELLQLQEQMLKVKVTR